MSEYIVGPKAWETLKRQYSEITLIGEREHTQVGITYKIKEYTAVDANNVKRHITVSEFVPEDTWFIMGSPREVQELLK